MNRNRVIILTIGLLLILTGIWAYPKIDQFFKVDSCLDKGAEEEGFEPPELLVSEKRDLLIVSLRY
jgi:hypothetical protein